MKVVKEYINITSSMSIYDNNDKKADVSIQKFKY